MTSESWEFLDVTSEKHIASFKAEFGMDVCGEELCIHKRNTLGKMGRLRKDYHYSNPTGGTVIQPEEQ